jgi:twinkle protein
MKSKVLHKTQCPRCAEEGKDTSKNNLAVYDNGHSHCFSCKYHVFPKDTFTEGITSADILKVSYLKNITLSNTIGPMTQQYISWRGVTADTMRYYGAIADVDQDDKPVRLRFPYGKDAAKVRTIGLKDFYAEGSFKDAQALFGMDRFTSGQNKTVVVTEGELDAMSVYQMLGGRIPAVSVRSGPSARKDCERARDWLNGFEHVYLCFDNDHVGREAAREVSKLFDINRVKHVDMSKYKDANEYLQAGEQFEFAQVYKNAKTFKPKGIVSDYSAIADILSKESAKAAATYPFPTLQEMTYGIRHGELVLFTAQEKIGKTEVMRAIEYHLLKTTDDAIGVIHLEEGEKRATQGLVGYELGIPVHLPDAGVSVDDQVAAYKSLTKRDGRLHFYAHFGSDDPNTILDIIRYLVTVCHCKYIFLDHITMLVTGFEDEDERKKLDYISTRLAMMTRELDFTLFLVSHVNDDGKTRGSRNISKVADLIINLDRNIEGATLDERNTTVVTVRGNRFASRSGPAGYLWFDPKTHTISELTVETAAEWDTKGF